jgi:hypothetical protein
MIYKIIEKCLFDKRLGTYKFMYDIKDKYYLLSDNDNIIYESESKDELEKILPYDYMIDKNGMKLYHNHCIKDGVMKEHGLTEEEILKLEIYMRKYFKFKNLTRDKYIKSLQIVSPEILSLRETISFDGINIRGSHIDFIIGFKPMYNTNDICIPDYIVDVSTGYFIFNE